MEKFVFSFHHLTADCRYGATCIDGIASYSCQCVEGFAGEHCEINLFDCASDPCQNGASCIDLKSVNHDCVCCNARFVIHTKYKLQRLFSRFLAYHEQFSIDNFFLIGRPKYSIPSSNVKVLVHDYRQKYTSFIMNF